MGMRCFDAVVFDFDGVLVESVDVKTEAFVEIYRPFGEDVVRKVSEYHLAHGGVSRFEKFKYFHEEFLGQPLSQYELAHLCERFSNIVEGAVAASSWVPGAKKILDSNYDKLPLYVASGTPQNELRRIVERRNMTRYFRGIFGSPSKKAEILRSIAEIEGCATSRLLMVGDAMTDYDGAVEVGASFVGRVLNSGLDPFPKHISRVCDLTGLNKFLWK